MNTRRIQASTAAIFLFALVTATAPASGLPQCQECTCFHACNQLCIVQDNPGSHEEICDMWLCRDYPQCQLENATSDVEQADYRAVEAAVSQDGQVCADGSSVTASQPISESELATQVPNR